MTYTWRCTRCRQTVDVTRSMARSDIGPELEETVHDDCTGQVFTRVITNGQRVIVHENEAQYFK